MTNMLVSEMPGSMILLLVGGLVKASDSYGSLESEAMDESHR